MRDHIVLTINGQEHRLRGPQIFSTLSNYLRYDAGATGTKVVCEEGDCGACTVLVRRSADEPFRPVNSCIQSLCQLDGTSIVTVEGLKCDGKLNPVQEAMVACHGAQCGYCTPGFVVAMTALFERADRVDEPQVRAGLTGNLCRCTGYEPIIKAALAVDGASMPKLRDIYRDVPANGAVSIDAGGRKFFAPETLAEAIAFKAANPGCTIVQGATDVGVWINKRGFAAPAMLSLAKIEELDTYSWSADVLVGGSRRAGEDAGAPPSLTVGANVTLSTLEDLVRERIPELYRILTIFGSPQIRNAGTLAGNIANGSPIGDTLPFLFVAGAELELAGTNGTRTVPIDRFYLGYKKFDLRPDEIIARVRIPIPPKDEALKLYKVSRRRDLDISAFTAAIRMRAEGGTIEWVKIAYGGVAPLVLRLPKTEEFLAGKRVAPATFEEAGRIAIGEISPITDVRGSRDYRLRLAENILLKFHYDLQS